MNYYSLVQGIFKKNIIQLFLKKTFFSFSSLFLGLLIAALYGAEVFGRFAVVLSVISFISVISRLGYDVSLMKEVDELTRESKFVNAIQSSFLVSMVVTSSLLVVLILIKVVASDSLFNFWFYFWGGVSIPPFTLCYVFSGYLKSKSFSAKAVSLENGSITAWSLGIVLGCYFVSGQEEVFITLSYFMSSLIVLICGLRSTEINTVFRKKVLYGKISFKEGFRVEKSCFKIYQAMLLENFQQVSTVFVILSVAGDYGVGVFKLAERFCTLINYPFALLLYLTPPKISRLHKDGNCLKLKECLRDAASISFYTGFIIFFLVMMGVFVDHSQSNIFIDHGLLFFYILFFLGQVLNVAFGPLGYLLMMIGREVLFRSVMLVVFIMSIVSYYFIPQWFGVLGLAVAYFFVVLLQKILAGYLVVQQVGYLPMPYFTLKEVAQSYRRVLND